MTKLFYTILTSVSLVFLIVCNNLNSRINGLNNKVSDLEWTAQEHELSIQREWQRKIISQDVILNKLNSEYQMRERERAEGSGKRWQREMEWWTNAKKRLNNPQIS